MNQIKTLHEISLSLLNRQIKSELIKGKDYDEDHISVPSFDDFIKEFEPQMKEDDWQTQLKRKILDKEKVIVNVPPSAGKTTPVLNAIRHMFIQYINGVDHNNFPIIYIVPRKQLAGQIGYNDIKIGVFLKIVTTYLGIKDKILKILSNNRKIQKIIKINTLNKFSSFEIIKNQLTEEITLPDSLKNEIRSFLESIETGISNNDYKYIKFDLLNIKDDKDALLFANELVEEMEGSQGDPTLQKSSYINKTFNGLKPIIVCTYEPSSKIILKYNQIISHVIVDELQELLPHPGEYNLNDEFKKRYYSLIDNIKYINKKAGIILMTGSVNYQTINKLIQLFSNHLRVSFGQFPENYNPSNKKDSIGSGNYPILNRTENIVIKTLQSLSGMPTATVPARLALCKNIILSNQTNSIMIIFSKGKSGQGIFAMISQLVNSIPPRGGKRKQQDGNVSYNDSFLYDARDLTIGNITSNKIIRMNDGDIKEDILINPLHIGLLKRFDLDDLLSKKNNESCDALELEENTENLLYRGVLAGVAPLIGPMDQNHKKILQQLFINKKIPLILATDALGVGANVECRHLYIPTIDKPGGPGGSLNRVDESSTTQLIHRVGRGKFKAGVIYCSIEDYSYIKYLIENDPRSITPELEPNILDTIENLIVNRI